MNLRLKALRSLRWNYTRKGVWFWLKGRQSRRCTPCKGTGTCGTQEPGLAGVAHPACCLWCDGTGRIFGKRGYQRILSEPKAVIAEQEAVAEGVMG